MKFLDISKQDLPIKNEIITEIKGVIDKNDFILGKKLNNLKKIFLNLVDLNTLLDVEMEQML